MAQPVTKADLMADIMALSIPERIRLAQDIWNSVKDEPEAFAPLTQAQRDELDRRLAAHEADPEAGYTWEELLARFQKRS
jgi:putative addiction module component (TIGR02574 family)